MISAPLHEFFFGDQVGFTELFQFFHAGDGIPGAIESLQAGSAGSGIDALGARSHPTCPNQHANEDDHKKGQAVESARHTGPLGKLPV